MLTEKRCYVTIFFRSSGNFAKKEKPANHKICRSSKKHSQYAVCLSHSVFHRFADTELDGGLRRDVDHGTGCRVAPLTSLAVRLLQFAESGQCKFAVLFYFAGSESGKSVKHSFNVRFLGT